MPFIHSTASFIRLSDHLALGRGGAGLLRLPLLEPSFLLQGQSKARQSSARARQATKSQPVCSHRDLPEDEPSFFFFFLRPLLLGSRGVPNIGCAQSTPLRREQPRPNIAV